MEDGPSIHRVEIKIQLKGDAQKQIGTRKKHHKLGKRNISGETAVLQRLGREAVWPLVGRFAFG